MQALGIAPQPKKARPEQVSQLVDKVLLNAITDPIHVEPSTLHAPLAQPVTRTWQGDVDASAMPRVAAAASSGATPQEQPAQDLEAGINETVDGGVDDSAAQAASAALRNIAAGLHTADGAKRAGMVRVVEKRNFAGREVEIARELEAGTKAAEAAQHRVAAAANKSGLDAALANISGMPVPRVDTVLCAAFAVQLACTRRDECRLYVHQMASSPSPTQFCHDCTPCPVQQRCATDQSAVHQICLCA
jgi:hypothetical protein